MNIKKEFCGKIIIVGKPNVGKSTLFNNLLNKKISITSSKSNTTQQHLTGIHTINEYQLIYTDTPGINKKNKVFLRNFDLMINESNFILFIVEHILWCYNDEFILNILKNYNVPILLVLNKIDKLKNKKLLLPHINFLSNKFNFLKLVPISLKKKNNIHILSQIIQNLLPISPHKYPKNHFTNSSFNFIISEMIREKFLRYFNKEIPYNLKILINSIVINKKKEYVIKAQILVNNHRHKKIIVGSKGEKIKRCSLEAKKEIKYFLNKKVELFLWVIQNR